MKQLYRSRYNKKLFGLCGGLGETWNLDANLLRILLIVIAVFSGGSIILVYILAALIIPKEPYYPPYGGNRAGYAGHHDQHFGQTPPPPPTGAGRQWQEPSKQANNFDSMMDDLEKKALRKEIADLKSKLDKHEKGEF